MAYLTVTTPIDVVAPGDGELSLREAIVAANATEAPDTIRFLAVLEGQTLVLTGGELEISTDLTIDGDTNNDGTKVTLSGNHKSRVFNVSRNDADVNVNDMIIADGSDMNSVGSYNDRGGAILFLGGSLNLTNCLVRDSVSTRGAGIYARFGSAVSVIRSAIIGNEAPGYNYDNPPVSVSGGGIAGKGNVTLIVRDSVFSENVATDTGGAIFLGAGSLLIMENSTANGNYEWGDGGVGGAIHLQSATAIIERSTLADNHSDFGGAIFARDSRITLSDSTLVENSARDYAQGGGIYLGSGNLIVSNSTITGNFVEDLSRGGGGGIFVNSEASLDIANSIVVGNRFFDGYRPPSGSDIYGAITFSNGHNVFGTDVAGNIAGDRENVAPSAIFAAIDPNTGGGKLGPDGTVALRNNVANPALSAGDPILANVFDQRGATRPQPASSLPDLGAVELDQQLSTGVTANNDVRTGTDAVNNLTGLVGNDLLRGLGGNDTLDGGNGGDFLDGGLGNDKLTGGTGLDLVSYAGEVAVVVDLTGTTDTAKRGGETDTLIGIEGALGSKNNDTFKGDALANEFQGKRGKDTMSGGSSRDTWDFNDVADSPAGATRDVVTDFDHLVDVLDLAGVDADSTVPGNQSFRWVGKAVLTGAAQLGYYTTGGMTIVRASTDADAAAELEIQLTGVKVLTEGDFRP